MEIKKQIEFELLKKGYTQKTIETYSSQLLGLNKFFSPKSLNDLSFQDIEEYMDYLKNRRRVGPISQNQARKAYSFWFNVVLEKKYNFDHIPINRNFRRTTPEIFSENEILDLISKADNIRERVIISLGYGCGFDVGELLDIRIIDIDLKRQRIRTRLKKGKKNREALIPCSIVNDIEIYLKEYKPKKWLFEGRIAGAKLSTTAVQFIFKQLFQKIQCDKNLTFRSLRYSYIKHLQKQGVSMLSILSEMNLNSQSTYWAFGSIGEKNEPITFSPLDNLFVTKTRNEFNVDTLLKTINKLTNNDEKDYLLESVDCLRNSLPRAGIIMAWNAAIRNIHYKLLKHPLHSLNTAIKKFNTDSKEIKAVDDFAFIKESIVLKAALELNEFDKNEKGILDSCLDMRNKCSHPGKYRPDQLKVAGFIEDLISIVFSR